MKPWKERLKIYKLIALFGVALVFVFLLAGYEYSKASGFYKSTERNPLSFSEALNRFPSEFLWFLTALVLIVSLLELFIFIIKKITKN